MAQHAVDEPSRSPRVVSLASAAATLCILTFGAVLAAGLIRETRADRALEEERASIEREITTSPGALEFWRALDSAFNELTLEEPALDEAAVESPGASPTPRIQAPPALREAGPEPEEGPSPAGEGSPAEAQGGANGGVDEAGEGGAGGEAPARDEEGAAGASGDEEAGEGEEEEGERCGLNRCGPDEVCCNPSCGFCAAPGEDCPQYSCEPRTVPASEMCGMQTCNVGQVCCNPSCGTCVTPGERCDMNPCGASMNFPESPISLMCGMQTCNMGEVCCNPSCGICVLPGETCSKEPCR